MFFDNFNVPEKDGREDYQGYNCVTEEYFEKRKSLLIGNTAVKAQTKNSSNIHF